MRYRRLTATLGALAALSLGLTGCNNKAQPTAAPQATSGNATPASTSAAPAPQDAKKALQAATERLRDDTVRVEMTNGELMTMSAVMDPKAKASRGTVDIKAGAAMKMETILLDKDLYLKVDGEAAKALGGKWLHVDTAKLPKGGSFGALAEGDPAGTDRLVQAVTEVKRDGERGFTGILDMTKSPNADKATLDKLGAKATKVPFTATVDEQGRLATLVLDMTSLQPGLEPMRVRYYDFGAKVDVQRPAASEVTEAPAALTGGLPA